MRPHRAVIQKAIDDGARGGKKSMTRTAALLGCSRPTLYNWIYQVGLEDYAGIRQDRRLELDERERKNTRAGKQINSAVKPAESEARSLRLMPQPTMIEMPVTATVKLPESLWKMVRKTAIDEDCTVSQFVEDSLRDKLAACAATKRKKGEATE